MSFNQKDHDFNDHQMRMAASRILVGNLNPKITKGDLEEKFCKYGKVLDIEMHKVFAYVQFEREADSVQGLKNENGTMLKGTRLEITHEMDRNGQRPGLARSRSPPGGNRFQGPGPGYGRDRSPIRGPYDGDYSDSYKKDDRFSFRPEGYPDDFCKYPGRRFEEDPLRFRLDPKEEMMHGRAFIPPSMDARPDEFSVTQQCNDCEIVVLNKQQRDYAESVERRLKTLGLTVDLMFLVDEMALVRTIRDLARRGTLYTIIINRQNEMHLSVTLNILHDNPQEHRNMPLEDAMKLVSRNYQDYIQKKRERVAALNKVPDPALPPVEREIQLILNTLADNKYVTLLELEKVIIHLQDRRDRMKAAETAKLLPKEEVSTAEQQDLQQRILSIINKSDVSQNKVQAPAAVPLPVPPPPASSAMQQATPSPFLNFDNPNVQKALDSLIQSGPNLLKSISLATTQPLPNQNQPSSQPPLRSDPSRSQFGSIPGTGQPMRHPLLGTQIGGSNNYFSPRASR